MKQLKIKKISIFNLIVIAMISFVLMSNISFAKYETAKSVTNDCRIALMANNVSYPINMDTSGYPGSTPLVYPITITNKQGDDICQVKETYSFTIRKQNNIPLTFNLYSNEACTNLITPTSTQNDGATRIYSNSSYLFNPGIEGAHTYYLKVQWPSTENNHEYAFEIEAFSIDVTLEQVN